jgi:polar amino acid transport system substrate-binding protein
MASLKDLIGKRIGVQTGTLYGEFLSKNYPETQVLSYSSTADMIMALKSSKIDGIMIDGNLRGSSTENQSGNRHSER